MATQLRRTRPQGREVTLDGVLVARLWKASGKVAGVAISTLDEREYAIADPDCPSAGLLKHLRRRVRLTGRVVGARVVQIKAVMVLDSLGMPESPPKGDAE